MKHPPAHRFCRILGITSHSGSIEVKVGQGRPLPYTHLTLDRSFRVTSVSPDAQLAEFLLPEIPAGATARRRQEFFHERRGRVRILRDGQ